MMKTRAFILLFLLLAAGCTVQLYPPMKKVEPLPPAQVEPVSVTPDGGVVMVNGDTIPQEYSARKRFYWEQIEQSDSTQSFAVTNGSKDGRWLRGDSMRWHTSGPFVTVMTDTVATRAYARSIDTDDQAIDTLSYNNATGILSASLSSDGVPASTVDLDRYYTPGKIPYSNGAGFLTTGNVNYNSTPTYTNGLVDIVNTSVWTAGLSFDFDGDTTANNGVAILPKSGYGQEVNFFNIGSSGGTTNIISNVMNGDPGLGGSFSDYAHLGFFVVRRTGNEVDGIANDATRYVTGKPAYIFNNGNNLAPQVLGVGVGDSPLSGGHNIAIYRRDSTVDNSASFPPYNFLYTNYGGVVMSAPGTKFPVTNPLGGTNQLQAALDSLNANLPGDPQYAQSYNEGGENTSVTAGTPEQVISTTLGTTDTIAATSEFTVQSDADIQYTGSNDAVIKITAEAAIDPSSSVYALYYIAINGVIQNSSRFRVYSPGTSIQPMSVNITFIDTDADNGDVYSLYVDSTGGTIGYTVYDFRLTAEKIK